MAKKRLSDTEKWRKKFFRAMPKEFKLFWIYLLDDCDHAGIWEVDFETASLWCGFKIKEDEVIKHFDHKIHVFDDGEKWFIPSFISFQYFSNKIKGINSIDDLIDSNSTMHQSVISLLRKYNLMDIFKDQKNHSATTVDHPATRVVEEPKVKTVGKAKEEIKEFMDYFNSVLHKKLSLTPDRQRIIRKRLDEGKTLEELCVCVDNFALDPWPERHKFIDVVYCIGTIRGIDQFDKWNEGGSSGPLSEITPEDERKELKRLGIL